MRGALSSWQAERKSVAGRRIFPFRINKSLSSSSSSSSSSPEAEFRFITMRTESKRKVASFPCIRATLIMQITQLWCIGTLFPCRCKLSRLKNTWLATNAKRLSARPIKTPPSGMKRLVGAESREKKNRFPISTHAN